MDDGAKNIGQVHKTFNLRSKHSLLKVKNLMNFKYGLAWNWWGRHKMSVEGHKKCWLFGRCADKRENYRQSRILSKDKNWEAFERCYLAKI